MVNKSNAYKCILDQDRNIHIMHIIYIYMYKIMNKIKLASSNLAYNLNGREIFSRYL